MQHPYFCTPKKTIVLLKVEFVSNVYVVLKVNNTFKLFNAATSSTIQAEVAHLVEHDLAKVGVAGSSPVFRSKKLSRLCSGFFFNSSNSGGGTGRHAGLKILFPATGVTVRFRSRVLLKAAAAAAFVFYIAPCFNCFIY